MILKSSGALNIYDAETGEVVIKLEGVEVWKMLQATPDYPYLPGSGKCIVCGADTLWGDAPHKDDCRIVRYCDNCGKAFVAPTIEDSGDFESTCPACLPILRAIDQYECEQLDIADRRQMPF